MNFLGRIFEDQYGTEKSAKIFSAFNLERKVSLRCNRLKSTASEIAEILALNDIDFRQCKWSEDSFVLNNADEKKIRELSVYEEGKIYLQNLSSQLPPIVLAPRAGTDILDMAAAPGGKTTQLAAISGGKAHITACEKNKIRAERLRYNLSKQGANNVFVMTQDARKLDDFFSFDQILLDAPCSGSGTLNMKNEKQIQSFTEELIQRSVVTQRAMLAKACKLLKKGGELVYSTCSLMCCENEDNIAEIMKENMEIIPVSFKGIEELPLLPAKISGTIVVAPDDCYEGFFVAKLRKIR